LRWRLSLFVMPPRKRPSTASLQAVNAAKPH
jgi:hypothetical protein